MSNEMNPATPANDERTARREFLGKVGKAAVTAPAVALLLTASANPASAQYRVSSRPVRPSPRWSGVTDVERP